MKTLEKYHKQVKENAFRKILSHALVSQIEVFNKNTPIIKL